MLGDVLTRIEAAPRRSGKATSDLGYSKHYAVFTEVRDTSKYSGTDTWERTQAHFGAVSAQDMGNALIELSKSDKSSSIKVGKRVLVSFSEKDFAELAELIK